MNSLTVQISLSLALFFLMTSPCDGACTDPTCFRYCEEQRDSCMSDIKSKSELEMCRQSMSICVRECPKINAPCIAKRRFVRNVRSAVRNAAVQIATSTSSYSPLTRDTQATVSNSRVDDTIFGKFALCMDVCYFSENNCFDATTRFSSRKGRCLSRRRSLCTQRCSHKL